MAETAERHRLVVLGSGRVGKTSIIRRYLHGHFPDKYKETVEDIFSRNFRIRGSVLPLDILDTNFNYPDMRRISLSSGNAFLIVFAVDSVASFKYASEILDEICERRKDIKRIPLVVVGNKSDLPLKKINTDTAEAWLSRVEKSSERKIPYLQTSAMEGDQIVEIFQNLLSQSGFPNLVKEGDPHPPHLLAPLQGLQRARSFRMRSPARSPTRKRDADAVQSKPLTRHGSLVRRTQRLSLKIKQAPAEEPDESDCRIS